jgi:hypothetical protein
MTMEQCHQRVLDLLREPALEIDSEVADALVQACGVEVLVIHWDTGGAFGAGYSVIWRLGDKYWKAEDTADELYGPYDSFFQAADGFLFVNEASRSMWCDYSVEEIAGLLDLEFAPEIVNINGHEWPVEQLRELKAAAMANQVLPGETRVTVRGLDLDQLKSATIKSIEADAGSLDLGDCHEILDMLQDRAEAAED